MKIFYPPEGLCRAEPEDGPIVFTFHFIGIDNGTGISKSPLLGGLFFFENVLSPEGTPKGEPKVVQLFLLSILLWSEKGI